MMRLGRQRESGNILLIVFAAIAVLGTLTIGATQFISGPLKTSTEVTRQGMATTQLQMNGRLLILDAINLPPGGSQGDCDEDSFVEPREWRGGGAGTPGGVAGSEGGGLIPAEAGAARMDPWGTEYGYCVWNMGPALTPGAVANCAQNGTPGEQRLQGSGEKGQTVFAVISAGPDRVFETACMNYDGAGTEGVVEAAGSDDKILAFTYAEAEGQQSDLWNIKDSDDDFAEIQNKNIEIAGSGGTDTARIGYDATIGSGGVGDFLAIKTDRTYGKDDLGDTVEFKGKIRLMEIESLPKPEGID